MNLTLPLAHVVLAFVTLGTFIVRTSSGDSHTSLLRSGYSGKAGGARAFDVTTDQRAFCIWTTCSILLARIDTLEIDAGLISGAVAVGSTPYLTDPGATDLTSRALLA
jgi:hypothetical protein